MATIAEIRKQYPDYQDLTDEQLGEALHKKFYSDMPKSEFDVKAGLSAPRDERAILAPTLHDASTGVGQGLTLGFGDEIMAGAAAPFRAGYNALQGKGFDLGSAYDTELKNQRDILHTGQERSPIASTVGQVAGGVMAPMPVPGPAPATVLGMAGRGALGGAGVGAAYGFGSGEGGLENRAIGAAKSGAIGGVVGGVLGGVTGAIAKKVARNQATTGAAVRELAKDSFTELDNLGPIDKSATDTLITSLRDAAAKGRVSPQRNGAALSIIDDMEKEFSTQGATPGTLAAYRKIINSDLLGDKGQQRAGMVIRDALDEFIQSGDGGDVLNKANSYFRRSIQLEKVQNAIKQAEEGGGITSRDFGGKLKTKIGALLDADRNAIVKGRPPQFDPDMRDAMEAVKKTGGVEAFLRVIGKFSPDSGLGFLGHGLTAASTLASGGSTLPQFAAGAGAYAAKNAAASMTENNVDALIRIINHDPSPQVTARARALLQALTKGTIAGTQ